jgi:TM2 domain-containing membrane protein YozV
MDSARQMMEYDARKKSVLLAYLLWFFLGYFGIHRIYLGRVASGLVQLVLLVVGWVTTLILIGWLILAGLVVWWLLDALLIPGMTERRNLAVARSLDR